MSASLVGSEMCIRDRARSVRRASGDRSFMDRCDAPGSRSTASRELPRGCLLYTSDAADDM
eukprot:6584467-Alexandrium_andersonii.AAC.1